VLNLLKINFRSKENFKGLYFNQVEISKPGEDGFAKIIPVGDFPRHPNGAHIIEKKHIKAMAANFANTKKDLLVDYEHESLWGNTKAAAWSQEIEARENGLYWKYPVFTPKASKMIQNKEYKYFSPVYRLQSFDKKGRDIGATIHSVALTNIPYFDNEIDHIKNTNSQEDKIMLSKEALTKLGLPQDATGEQIEEAINALDAEPDPSTNSGTGTDAELAEVSENESEVNSDFETRLKVLEDKERVNAETEKKIRAETLINSAISRFKILPKDKDIWMNSALHDYDSTKNKLETIKENTVKPGSISVYRDEKGKEPKLNMEKAAADFFKSQTRTPLLNTVLQQ
jgi:phage I-like protein